MRIPVQLIMRNTDLMSYFVSGSLSLGVAFKLFNDIIGSMRPAPESFVFLVLAAVVFILSFQRIIGIIGNRF